MKKQFLPAVFVALVFAVIGLSWASADAPATTPAAEKIKMLIVTGGHGFKHDPFFKIFQDNADVTYTEAAEGDFKKGSATAYDRDDLGKFDVVLLYDFQLNITDAQKKNFLALFDRGTGLIVLHHALLSYQAWPEYERIAGGSYLLDFKKYGDKIWPESTYKGDTDMDVVVADKETPVTAGISDFHMKDEIYRGVHMTEDIHPVLMCEGKPLAWTREEKKSRVVSIIIGHGAGSYENPNFLKLVGNSIRWAAKRE